MTKLNIELKAKLDVQLNANAHVSGCTKQAYVSSKGVDVRA